MTRPAGQINALDRLMFAAIDAAEAGLDPQFIVESVKHLVLSDNPLTPDTADEDAPMRVFWIRSHRGDSGLAYGVEGSYGLRMQIARYESLAPLRGSSRESTDNEVYEWLDHQVILARKPPKPGTDSPSGTVAQ